jgi:hypothetical protein
VIYRYRGPAQTGPQRQIREWFVAFVASGCIVVASGAATLLSMWNPWA